MRRSPDLLTALFAAACDVGRVAAALPDSRVTRDGQAVRLDFVAVEGDGERRRPARC